MKYLLLYTIEFYWKLIPDHKRKKCIFKETCSHHVYRICKEHGFKKGIKALKERYKQCRPEYVIYKSDDNDEWVILKDKVVIERKLTNL
jgi:putative component of membrane protein insertase Oxa1/YidC/SpoIIIJ protein YidD